MVKGLGDNTSFPPFSLLSHTLTKFPEINVLNVFQSTLKYQASHPLNAWQESEIFGNKIFMQEMQENVFSRWVHKLKA